MADIRQLRRILGRAIEGWIDDRASSMGAALAYYTAFSMAPLLLIVISIAGFFFGNDAARGALIDQIGNLIGPAGANVAEAVLAGMHNRFHGSLISALIGIAALLLGATSVFNELQADLDRIWKVPASSLQGIGTAIRSRLLSVGLILGLAFLLLVSLIVSAIVAALGKYLAVPLPGHLDLLRVAGAVLSFAVTDLIFTLIYKLLPRTRVRWQDVWVGGLFTTALFEVGKLLIGLYISKAAVASSFGAAGTLAVLLAWMYYSAQIFLFGAELTFHQACVLRPEHSAPPTCRQ